MEFALSEEHKSAIWWWFSHGARHQIEVIFWCPWVFCLRKTTGTGTTITPLNHLSANPIQRCIWDPRGHFLNELYLCNSFLPLGVVYGTAVRVIPYLVRV
jgi:hypothetical protein